MKLTPPDILTGSTVNVCVIYECMKKALFDKTPNDLLEIATRYIDTNELPESIDNKYTYFGNKMEKMILEEAALTLGLTNITLDHDKPFYHGSLPLAVSLDGSAVADKLRVRSNFENVFVMSDDKEEIVLDGFGVIEAKNTKVAPEIKPELHRGPIQMQAQMMCTNAKWGALAVFYQGCLHRTFVFEPHAGTQQLIAKCAVDFDKRVQNYRKTGTIDWYDAITTGDYAKIYPNALEESIELGDDANSVIDRIEEIKSDIKNQQSELEKLDMKLKDMLGSNKSGFTNMYKLSWGMRNYKAQPEKITPAKEAYSVRQKSVTIKKILEERG